MRSDQGSAASKPSAIRIRVWEALSELCLDTELQPSDFASISRILVEAGLDDAEIERAWLREVAPVCFTNLLSVAGEWAGFNREWLVGEITRPRRWRERALAASLFLFRRASRLPDWLELKSWIALRRASPALLDSELHAPEPARRLRAAILTAEQGGAGAASLIEDPDPGVRRQVLRLARGLAREQIAARLEDADEGVRQEAARRLAREAQAGDLSVVLEALARGSGSVRYALAGVPWRIVDVPTAIDALGRMLGDPVSGRRLGAAAACTARWSELSRDKSPADERHRPLRDALSELAFCGVAEERSAAVTALGWWQAWTGEAALDLAAFAKDPEPAVRESAAYALGHAGRADPDALAALERLLEDEPSRFSALYAAKELGARAASLRPHVEKLRHAKDPLVRGAADSCAEAMDQP
jgi:HEAT repeat protein